MTDIVPNGMDAGRYPNAGKGRQASEMAVEKSRGQRLFCALGVFCNCSLMASQHLVSGANVDKSAK